MQAVKIENLNRIFLQIKAGCTADTMDITDSVIHFDFIYGLGSGGLTPFEYTLAELHCGDTVQLHIHTNEIDTYFEHIQLPVFYNVQKLPSFYLNILVHDVRKAEPREVIKAMASIAGCGCSCCGDHDPLAQGDPGSEA